MKTKTKIEGQLQRKTNKELVDTLIFAKKRKEWLKIAGILSGPRRKDLNVNLSQINENVKEGDTVLVPGKVLSQGDITKKIKIVAFKFSEKAREKILKAKIQTSNIIDEIKKNPDAKGIKIFGE